jgi:hypothetical protein
VVNPAVFASAAWSKVTRLRRVSLNSEADAFLDAPQNECFEFPVYGRPNVTGDAGIGTAVQLGGAIVGIETGDPEA